MTFGCASAGRQTDGEVTFLTDELGELLNGVTLLVFGAVLLWPALDGHDLADRASTRSRA